MYQATLRRSKRRSKRHQDILNKISDYLRNDTDKLLPILTFFIDHDNQRTARCLQVLRSVFTNDVAFKKVVDKLAEDAQSLKNVSSDLRFVADTWNNCLLPNENKNVGVNVFNFHLVLSYINLTNTTAVFNFISTLSKLDSTVQNKVIQLITNLAEATVGASWALTLDNNFKNLLQVTKSTSANLVTTGLVTVFLTTETVTHLQLWWEVKISGKRCSKNIIDSFAGMAAGVGGGIVGAAAGSSIVKGLGLMASTPMAMGSIIGAVIFGVTSATAANKISDCLTQKLFNLPKGAALEITYKFLGLEYGASNNEINSNFRRLALKYHPDKGGSYDDWDKLQIAMAIIKLSKGEIYQSRLSFYMLS